MHARHSVSRQAFCVMGAAAVLFGYGLGYVAHRIKQKIYPPINETQTIATQVAKEKESLCSSDYPHFVQVSNPERPPFVAADAEIPCAIEGHFMRDGQKQAVGIAVGNEAYFYTLGKPYEIGVSKTRGAGWRIGGKDFKLHEFRITHLGIQNAVFEGDDKYIVPDPSPHIIVVYSDEGKKKTQVFHHNTVVFKVRKSFEYEPVSMTNEKGIMHSYIEADNVHIKDLDGDGVKEIVVLNGRIPSGLKRPIDVLTFVLSLRHPGSVEYAAIPLKAVQETRQRIVEAARNPVEIRRIISSNPYASAGAINGLIAELANSKSMRADLLYRDLFGMEPIVVVDHLLSIPQFPDKFTLVAKGVERFLYHLERDYDDRYGIRAGGSGHSFVFEGQGHCCLSSRDALKQEIARLERRKEEEANRPTAYHTFVERSPDGRSERRVTLFGPSMTRTEWETKIRMEQDTVIQALKRGYEFAGAGKGDAERAGKEAYEKAGAIKGDVERGIKEFVESLSKPGKKR